jgi:hypothetical protein
MNHNVFCENIKKRYYANCHDLVIKDIAYIEMKFIALFIGAVGVLYLKNNNTMLSKLIFQVSYKSFLAATKISNAYKGVKNYFVSSEHVINNNDNKKIKCIYDEVKVIKDGVRQASFETMETFKDASYLGNPNDYYDVHEIVDSESPCSPYVDSSSFSSSSDSSASSESSSYSEDHHDDPLFIMEKNDDSDDALEFKSYDFILHTNYDYSESNQSQNKNYTRIYRTFTANDYAVKEPIYEISNTEMIICTLEIDNNGKLYEIDLSYPYNVNVVGNVILDEKFVYWYMLKKYDYVIECSENYKITCITKDVNTFQLDRSYGLRVHLNNYTLEKMV